MPWFQVGLWLVLLVPTGLPEGSGSVTVEAGGLPIEVFTYKPTTYKADGPMLMVFHGVLRNADEYRDHARGMGDRFGALVVAPRFDAERFPSAKFHRGGLLQDGRPAPPAAWTWSLVPKLARALRRLEGRPEMPYYLIGHSAGGQFVERMAGFVDTEATRLVAANPGTHLFPTTEMDYPLGLGGLPQTLRDDEHVRRYLAQPLTLYLGTADTERDEYLATDEESDRQGRVRYERGQNVFRAAEQLAKARGWRFGWRLVEAPGVGHDHQAMFDHPACAEALFDRDQPPAP